MYIVLENLLFINKIVAMVSQIRIEVINNFVLKGYKILPFHSTMLSIFFHDYTVIFFFDKGLYYLNKYYTWPLHNKMHTTDRSKMKKGKTT